MIPRPKRRPKVARRDVVGQDRRARPALELLEQRNLFSFLGTMNYDVGPGPTSVAVGDFNGDGNPDVVATSYASSEDKGILLGNGDGKFRTGNGYPSGGVAVAVADFNGDGIQDLALAGGGGVGILLGNGDGSFGFPHGFDAGDTPSSIAVGDFNGDGLPDVAVSNSGYNGGQGGVTVLLGNGDGTLGEAHTYTTGVTSSAVAVADFNGDGIADLVVTNSYTNDVSVLLGNGDGTFQSTHNIPVGRHPESVAVGDFKGDGVQDIAVANQGDYPHIGESVSVLLGNGDGTFQAAHDYAAGPNPISVAVADFNGDGTADLIVVASGYYSGRAGANVLEGVGDGTFKAPVSYAVGAQPWSVAVGDFDRDGTPDAVIANYRSNNVTILLGAADGTFKIAPSFATDPSPGSVAVGDFNGDGHADLAITGYSVVNGASTLTIQLGNGDGSFRTAGTYDAGTFAGSVNVADFNGDGIPDIAVASAGSVKVFLGNGDGTFQSPLLFSVDNTLTILTVGDFNGDGIPDLATAGYLSSQVGILLGNGDGTFQPVHDFPAGTRPISIAVGDFNRDGNLDLVAVDEGNYGTGEGVTVLLGNGNGTFQSGKYFNPGNFPLSVAVGDFNGDGILDLALTGSDLGGPPGVKIVLGNGDGTFGPPNLVPMGSLPSPIVVGDFNGDGILDLAMVDLGGARIILGNGDGTFDPTPVSYATGTHPSKIAVGDFNGDGHADLAVTNNGSNDVTILLNDGIG
jgi:hypothetical protein